MQMLIPGRGYVSLGSRAGLVDCQDRVTSVDGHLAAWEILVFEPRWRGFVAPNADPVFIAAAALARNGGGYADLSDERCQ